MSRRVAQGGGLPPRNPSHPDAALSSSAPPARRGTAFGMLNLMGGVAVLLASLVAGGLWDSIGPQGTFLAGAVIALCALGGILPLRRVLRRHAADVARDQAASALR